MGWDFVRSSHRPANGFFFPHRYTQAILTAKVARSLRLQPHDTVWSPETGVIRKLLYWDFLFPRSQSSVSMDPERDPLEIGAGEWPGAVEDSSGLAVRGSWGWVPVLSC